MSRYPGHRVPAPGTQLGQHVVAALAQDQADGRRVVRVLQLVVDHVAVEVQLAGVLRLELAALQLDHHVAAQLDVEEQQVDEVLLLADLHPVLPPHEGEALAEFEQELLQVLHQPGFQLALAKRLLQRQEVEDVGILQRLADQLGLRRQSPHAEAAGTYALSLTGLAVDHQHQRGAAPALGR